MKSLKFQVWPILSIAWMLAIAVACLMPRGIEEFEPTNLQELARNLLHIPMYALLTYLLVQAFASWFQTHLVDQREDGEKSVFFKKAISLRARLWAFHIAIIYGALMEWMQGFVPGRFPSALDILLNAIGAGFVMVMLMK